MRVLAKSILAVAAFALVLIAGPSVRESAATEVIQGSAIDTRETALALTCPSQVSVDLTSATENNGLVDFDENGLPCALYNGVWFKFIAPKTGKFKFSFTSEVSDLRFLYYPRETDSYNIRADSSISLPLVSNQVIYAYVARLTQGGAIVNLTMTEDETEPYVVGNFSPVNYGPDGMRVSGYSPSISYNCDKILFQSNDTLLRDMENGTTTIIQHMMLDGTPLGLGQPILSGDGKHIYYFSGDNRIYEPGGITYLYAKDIVSDTIERLVAVADPGFFNFPHLISCSNDGRYISFKTVMNLAPEDMDGLYDIYIYDRDQNSVVLVSGNVAEDQTADIQSGFISGDGNYAVYCVSAAAWQEAKYYKYFLTTGNIQEIDKKAGETDAASPGVSDDGRYFIDYDYSNKRGADFAQSYLVDKVSEKLYHLPVGCAYSRINLSGDGTKIVIPLYGVHLGDSDTSVPANIYVADNPLYGQYPLLNAAVDGTGGTISADKESLNGSYDKGTEVTLTAVPDSGYRFAGWSGDASGTNPVLKFTMDTDKTVKAKFAKPAVTNVSITALAGLTGVVQDLTAVWSDGNGAANIENAYLKTSTAKLVYIQSKNKLYLYDDAGTTMLGGFAPGSANTVSNSSVTLDASGSTVSLDGNQLTVKFRVTPKAGYTGSKSLYMYAYDLQGNKSPMNENKGTWTITVPQYTPVNVSATAAAGTVDAAQDITGVWNDGNGASNLETMTLKMGTVKLQYIKSQNKLYLSNDAVTAWLGGFVPGSANTISNASMTLDASGSTVTQNGNQLTVKFRVTPKAGFTGAKTLYMTVADLQGNKSPVNEVKGSWTISATTQYAPVNVSATAASGVTGAAQDITAVWSDGNGAANIEYVIIKTSFAKLVYIQSQNKLYLYDDAGTTMLGGFAPGSVNTVSNSSLTLDASGSTVTQDGNQLTVKFRVTPKAGVVGKKALYMYSYDLQGNKSTMNEVKGTWTIAP